jgi:hypothetical protein
MQDGTCGAVSLDGLEARRGLNLPIQDELPHPGLLILHLPDHLLFQIILPSAKEEE